MFILTFIYVCYILGAAMPNGFNTTMLQSGSVWSLNKSLVKNVSPMGASAISDDYWRIPNGATKVRIKAGSYSSKVYFYTATREYAGSTGSTSTENEYDIPNNAVYVLVSLEYCTTEQMLSDGYQITFLDYLGSYGNLGSLANALGVIKRLDIPHTGREEIYKLDFTYWNDTSQGYRYCNFLVGNITGNVFCLGVAQEKTVCKISFGSTESTIPYRDNDGNIYIRTGAYSPFSIYGYRVTSPSYTQVTGTVSLDSLIQIS